MQDYKFKTFASVETKTALGELCVQWGILEGLVEVCIWRSMGVPYDIGRSATTQMQLLAKLDALCSILNQTNPHLATQFAKVANYIRNCLVGTRNTFIHGFWARDPVKDNFEFVVKFNAKGQLVQVGGEVTADEIVAFCNDIIDVSNWVMAFCDLLPPLPQVPDERGHKTRDKKDPQDYITQKRLALQPPTAQPSAQ